MMSSPFDYYAGNNNGNVTVNGGAGADTFIFGNGAENLSNRTLVKVTEM